VGGASAHQDRGRIEGRGSDWQGYMNNHEEKRVREDKEAGRECDDGGWTMDGGLGPGLRVATGTGAPAKRQVFSNRQGTT